jgi:asparagine synthase (glutamine-hydrolysing)
VCGFVGYLDPSVASGRGLPLLKAMTDAIAYRGPDESGHWAEEGVGVGHRRLSIVGLSTGQQPPGPTPRCCSISTRWKARTSSVT